MTEYDGTAHRRAAQAAVAAQSLTGRHVSTRLEDRAWERAEGLYVDAGLDPAWFDATAGMDDARSHKPLCATGAVDRRGKRVVILTNRPISEVQNPGACLAVDPSALEKVEP